MMRKIPRLSRALALTGLALLAGAGPVSAAPAAPDPVTPPGFDCAPGEFCAWASELYAGTPARYDLRNTNPEECVPLSEGIAAKSFVNRIDRDVTVYQDEDCATEADFTTYPGGGTFVPQAPFLVRAIQIWN
ncbi:Peptidase inhibitor family I36 [Amycolatopsis arida]|uniref:Peptidase inhibitor family I36 n=1 Tax=Amycolatopsis arida TaxID=587909 RepID=A0A1I5UKV4_9PSEU|nr:peptidase inhibitor family I36 protein [Amycolatopsis arida]TDX90932.1 peptidase inhibitor family I36 [Amycolatopsis arida]SFP95875.1 Peptidase inhibitor family I36 [Amycolatopsis arida]